MKKVAKRRPHRQTYGIRLSDDTVRMIRRIITMRELMGERVTIDELLLELIRPDLRREERRARAGGIDLSALDTAKPARAYVADRGSGPQVD